jgi:hypothetical protein
MQTKKDQDVEGEKLVKSGSYHHPYSLSIEPDFFIEPKEGEGNEYRTPRSLSLHSLPPSLLILDISLLSTPKIFGLGHIQAPSSNHILFFLPSNFQECKERVKGV